VSHDPRLTVYADFRGTHSTFTDSKGVEWGATWEEILESEAVALELVEFAIRHRVEVRVLTASEEPSSISFFAWQVEQMRARADTTSRRDKAALLRKLAPLVHPVGSNPEADLAWGNLLDELGLHGSELEAVTREAERQAYMASGDWDHRRRDALRRAGYRCQLCNADKPLDVHHRTYERFGNELPGDLIALCRECHDRFHAKGAANAVG